jgi:hypothetical protein
MPIILASWEAEIKRIIVQNKPDSLLDPISKIPNTKRASGVAQVAECLLNKPETLSSNLTTAKQNKTKNFTC